jgi:hypothetical protein
MLTRSTQERPPPGVICISRPATPPTENVAFAAPPWCFNRFTSSAESSLAILGMCPPPTHPPKNMQIDATRCNGKKLVASNIHLNQHDKCDELQFAAMQQWRFPSPPLSLKCLNIQLTLRRCRS